MSIDGTKIKVSASKHSAVSCKHAGEQSVEPVFGVIKEVLGFRRFSMRGKEKAETEWCLVCLSYKLKKIFKLMG